MKGELSALARALENAKAPVLFGFGGVSCEGQRTAFRLARALSAAVSVEPVLLPTLTRASLSLHDLILTTGGESPFPLPDSAIVLRDDRLLNAHTWRALSALQKGSALPDTNAYAALFDLMQAHAGAALIVCTDALPDGYRDALFAFREGCAWKQGFDFIQCPAQTNLLAAYDAALSELGGASGRFYAGGALLSDAYRLSALLSEKAVDAALLIGNDASEAKAALDAGVPLYVLGDTPVAGAALFVQTAAFPAEESGTLVYADGLSRSCAAQKASVFPTLCACIETLIREMRIC